MTIARMINSTNIAIEQTFVFSPEKKVLVLDLDETLIHCKDSKPENTDSYIEVTVEGAEKPLFVSIRPNLMKFLQQLTRYYTLVIYTAGTKEYAEAVIKTLKIDSYIATILHRKHCIQSEEGLYMKDLSIFQVPLGQILLINDSLCTKSLFPLNCLRVPEFKGNPDDLELFKLAPFLVHLASAIDVRYIDERYSKFLKMNPPAKKPTTPKKTSENFVSDDISEGVDKRKLLPMSGPITGGRF